MNKTTFSLFIIFTCLLLQSCATTQRIKMRHDPLIGKIVNTKSTNTISFDTLIDEIKSYDVIYLSEKHDNPDHHAFQADVIQALVEQGNTPVLGFEFFSMDNTPDILNFLDSAKVAHSKKSDKIIAADLRYKLGWQNQSDEMWQFYFDLLTLARDQKLAAAGIDLSTTLKRRITRKGIDGLSALEKEQLFSTHLVDPTYKEYMMDMFKAVHCGMGNQRMQEKLYDTWMARNDKMALSITQLSKHYKGPAVIIIGGGHTEYGLGVVDRVAAINPDLKQVNIALKEIYVEPAPLSDYLEPLSLAGYKNTPPADFIWFSQRVSYENPCDAFKAQLEKMKKRSKK